MFTVGYVPTCIEIALGKLLSYFVVVDLIMAVQVANLSSSGLSGSRKDKLMHTEIVVPQLPESTGGATIQNLRVMEGQEVAADQLLFELETDKVVLELVSPSAGTIQDIKVQVGDFVGSGQLAMTLRVNEELDTTNPQNIEATTNVEELDSVALDNMNKNDTEKQSTGILPIIFGVITLIIIGALISL